MARNTALEELACSLAREVNIRIVSRRVTKETLVARLSTDTRLSPIYCRTFVNAILEGYVRGYFPEKSSTRSEMLAFVLHYLQVPATDPLIERLRIVYPRFTYNHSPTEKHFRSA